MKKIITLLFIFLFLPLLFLYPMGEKGESLKILYTSSLNGNLDGCMCKSSPRSGLVKRAAYLRFLTDRENVVLVDTGDILDARPDELLAKEIFEAYSELGYDAIGVGDQEFSNGIVKLFEYRETFPLISNNLAICPDDKICIFFSSKPLVVEKGSNKIGIFSLIDPEVFTLYSDDFKLHIKVDPIKPTVDNIIFLLEEEEVDLKILLYHGPYENALGLAKRVKGIDVIIVGHEQRLIEAEKIGGSIVVSPGEEGNRIGIMELSVSKKGITDFKNSFKIFSYEDDPDDNSVKERIKRYQNEMISRIKNGNL